MMFMYFSEGEAAPGTSYRSRYWELVEQVLHAERWGFDSFGASEQHMAIGGVSTSSPEVLFAYLFPLTKRLRFRHAITPLVKAMNHPLKVAARTAVQDILSNGRIELGVGRGNTTLALRAFEVDLDRTRGEWYEGLQILKKAFTEDTFMFYGEHYKIPPRALVPKPVQRPHPPLFSAATSAESHRIAGELGIGVISWSNFLGWDALAESIASYKAAVAKTKATGAHVNDKVSLLVQGYCAETDESAREEAAEGNLKWLKLALDGYPRLAKMSKDYAYMAKVKAVDDRYQDIDYFVEGSAAAVFGSPDSCIRALERYASIGVDEVVLRIDSVPHERIMRSIELFGRHVIPHFRDRANIVRGADAVMRDIRAMREEAKRQGVYVELGDEKTKPPAPASKSAAE
ncbi:MAG: LLM class flavin-dependent oxidoreductase [Alphaproteobacteria bacterium]